MAIVLIVSLLSFRDAYSQLSVNGRTTNGNYYINGAVAPDAQSADFLISTSVVIIRASGQYDIRSNTTANQRIVVNQDNSPGVVATIKLTNVSITSTNNCAFSINGNTVVYLELYGNNSLSSGNGYAGLFVRPETTGVSAAHLIIDGYSPGSLTATGGAGSQGYGSGAGIGGHGNGVVDSYYGNSGIITINDGVITAKGGDHNVSNGGTGAGIGGGGGRMSSGGGTFERITINGGTLEAYGGNMTYAGANGGGGGAGIGGGGSGGIDSPGGNLEYGITITEGVVYAQGGSSTSGCGGAGIGGGGASNATLCGKLLGDILLTSPPAILEYEGGTGNQGDGAGIGDGGQMSEQNIPVITINTYPNDNIFVAHGLSESVYLSVVATVTNGGVATYQWFKCDDPDGANPQELTTDPSSPVYYLEHDLTIGEHYYYCDINASRGGIYGNKAEPKSTLNAEHFATTIHVETANKSIIFSDNNGQIINAGDNIYFESAMANNRNPLIMRIAMANDGNVPFVGDSRLTVEYNMQTYTDPNNNSSPCEFIVGQTDLLELIIDGRTNFNIQTKTKLPQGTYTAQATIGGTGINSDYSHSFSINLEITEQTITNVIVTQQPNKLRYEYGEPLDLTGLRAAIYLKTDETDDDELLIDFSAENFANAGITTTPPNGTIIYTTNETVTIEVAGITAQTDPYIINKREIVFLDVNNQIINDGDDVFFETAMANNRKFLNMIITMDNKGNVDFVGDSQLTVEYNMQTFTDPNNNSSPYNFIPNQPDVFELIIDGQTSFNIQTRTKLPQGTYTAQATISGTGANSVFSFSFNIHLSTTEQTIAGITVKQQPDKLDYNEGDSLNLTGLQIAILLETDENDNDERIIYFSEEEFANEGIVTNPAHGDILYTTDETVIIEFLGMLTQTEALVVHELEPYTSIEFDEYAIIKWENTIMLNMLKLNADFELLSNAAIKWYKDDEPEPIGSGTSYSSGSKITDKLNGTYHFEIQSSIGKLISTSKEILLETPQARLNAYPNPVASGATLTIENISRETPIQIITLSGTLVIQAYSSEKTCQISIPLPNGVYILRTIDGELKIAVQ